MGWSVGRSAGGGINAPDRFFVRVEDVSFFISSELTLLYRVVQASTINYLLVCLFVFPALRAKLWNIDYFWSFQMCRVTSERIGVNWLHERIGVNVNCIYKCLME